ncbi:MAG: type II toxin-antitoxin system MqsR family toxin [Alphaproteobacteria bacterium]
MEKRRPSHDLAAFQAAFLRDAAITMTALRSAIALGYGLQDVQEVVALMEPRHFVKSMTSNTNHRQWQDVYHVPHDGLLLYLKFTDAVVTEFVLLSFKEK